jgi:MFS family permease
LILLIYAMTSVPSVGWSVPTLATGVLGCALLAGFVAVEKRHPAPLVPLDLVTTRPVLIPNAAIALQSMIGIAWLYVLTLYFQEVIGTGPLKAGMLFVPMTLASLIAAPIAGRLGSRIGIRATAITGLTLLGCGIAAMMAGMSAGGSIALLLAGSAVGEAGFMLSNVSLVVAGTSGLDDKSGLAAGLLNTSTQLGNGWGLGVVALIVAANLPDGDPDPGSYADALRWGMFACICCCALALILVARGLYSRQKAAVATR